jgi:hypothetical protein
VYRLRFEQNTSRTHVWRITARPICSVHKLKIKECQPHENPFAPILITKFGNIAIRKTEMSISVEYKHNYTIESLTFLFPFYLSLAWGHYATSWKVASSCPGWGRFFFNLPNPSSRNMALGSTQPLAEMGTRDLSGGKRGRLTTLPPSVSRMSENVEASTSRNPKGLHGLYRDNFTFTLSCIPYKNTLLCVLLYLCAVAESVYFN